MFYWVGAGLNTKRADLRRTVRHQASINFSNHRSLLMDFSKLPDKIIYLRNNQICDLSPYCPLSKECLGAGCKDVPVKRADLFVCNLEKLKAMYQKTRKDLYA